MIFAAPRSSRSLAVASCPCALNGSACENTSTRKADTCCARSRSCAVASRADSIRWFCHRVTPAMTARPKNAASTPNTGEQVPAHELRGVVAPVALPRQHRPAEKVAVHIVRERLDRRIAAIRLLAHRHRHDGVQVAAQPRPQPLRRQAAPIGDAAAVGVRLAAELGDHHLARPHRIVHADRALELQLAVAQEPVRRAARQQLVQQHAERVDVGRGGDGAAQHLLGSGVLRSEDALLQPRHRHACATGSPAPAASRCRSRAASACRRRSRGCSRP